MKLHVDDMAWKTIDLKGALAKGFQQEAWTSKIIDQKITAMGDQIKN